MIKASGLRIGNWVSNGNKNFRICAIDIYDIAHVNFYHIEPIPLASEILQKCEFVFKTGELMTRIYKPIYSGVDGNLEIHYSVITNEVYLLFISGGVPFSASKRFKYLHQLQNLYFDLTEKELQVNL